MRIPASTYRLQLNSDFGFAQARALVPYLHDLGISDLYLSPILAPREGSAHGYDVTDPTRLNPALGSEEEFEQLVETARDHSMGILLDIVPNHMAASTENPWWRDVLTHGPTSDFERFFDIDWHPPWPGVDGKILLPVLGSRYTEVLEAGELEVARDPQSQTGSDFVVRYYDRTYPLNPRTTETLDDDGLERLNNDPDALDALLEAQFYALRFWRTERFELNYRRFFNISDLVSLRMEHEPVRRAVHSKLAELWKQRHLTGLRVDHIDGLRDPKGYLQWLNTSFPGPAGSKPYVLVEKILSTGETLPDDWPVAGTTGYEYLNQLNGVFVDPDGHRELDSIYAEFTGRQESFRSVVYQKKRFVIDWLFGAELDRLATELAEFAAQLRVGRDLTRSELAEALAEISAGLSVYRTYITEAPPGDRARGRIERAVALARRFNSEADSAPYDFIERVLLLEFAEAHLGTALDFVKSWQQFTSPLMAKGLEDTSLYVYNHLISLNTVGGEPDEGDVSLAEFHAFNARRLERWPGAMSSTSTHDSKRGEDVRLRVDVLSEMPVEWQQRLSRWAQWNEPRKIRPEVAEPPSRNEEMLLYQTLLGSWPIDEDELPAYPDRLRQYLIKSAREAKEKTSWHQTDERHEFALARFAERLLDDSSDNPFLDDFIDFQEEISFFGALNSLSQVTLKMASPGVADIYQGSEFWNLTLVDPDNRRPVDYKTRRGSLVEMRQVPDEHLGAYAVSLLRDWKDARIKQFVTWRALQLRRSCPALFLHGDYQPLYARQKMRPYICSFARSHEGRHAIALAPRRLSRLVAPLDLPVKETWARTYLSIPESFPSRWIDALTGETISLVDQPSRCLPLAEAFANLPVALLYADDNP
ncbi:MAG: malto-oligosyltrehalose synthase [Persicimonas sp.]